MYDSRKVYEQHSKNVEALGFEAKKENYLKSFERVLVEYQYKGKEFAEDISRVLTLNEGIKLASNQKYRTLNTQIKQHSGLH